MSDPVGLVTVHHEGAGAPSDNVQRFSEGGYCYGIGVTRFERFRSPRENWATLGYNHRDLTICLSGNRMDHEVTDSDIALIHGAFMDCFARGEVDSFPQVRAHRNSPGSSTVCPGDRTMLRWAAVVEACRPTVPTPEPEPKKDDMVIVSVVEKSKPDNQQPYAWLDNANRKLWCYWGFKVRWDGTDGDAPVNGTTDPRWIAVPGSAPLIGWGELPSSTDGKTKRFCAYGSQGAEYVGTAHG